MKLTRNTLRRLIFEVLNENSKQLQIGGKAVSMPGNPLRDMDPSGDMIEKINTLIDMGEPEYEKQALILLASFMDEESAKRYIAKHKSFKRVQDDPAYYSAKVGGEDAAKALNALFPEPNIRVTVIPQPFYVGASMYREHNYGLTVILSVALGNIDEENYYNLTKLRGTKGFDFEESKYALTQEQHSMISAATQKIESYIDSHNFKRSQVPINHGPEERLEHEYTKNSFTEDKSKLEYIKTYILEAEKPVPFVFK